MKKFKFFMPVGLLFVTAAFCTIVMLLWNWLMPSIFGLAVISFWQAVGLFLLTRILFSGFGLFSKANMMHHPDAYGSHIHKKWRSMSDEQRREFIERRRKFEFGHPHSFDMGEYDKERGTEDKQ